MLKSAEEQITWTQRNWYNDKFTQQALKLENKCTHTSVKKPVKFGGGRLMVWWMFSAAKFEPLTHPLSKVNANVPMKLLQHRLFPP